MDYCNSLYYGVDARALMRLQKIQNAAAKIIKSAKKYESVTPLWISLNRMPVRIRMYYFLRPCTIQLLCICLVWWHFTPSLDPWDQKINICFALPGQNINIEVTELFLQQALNCGMTSLDLFDPPNPFHVQSCVKTTNGEFCKWVVVYVMFISVIFLCFLACEARWALWVV